MKRFKFTKAMALTMGTVMSLSAFASLAGCAKTDTLVLMSDELNNLFSPFYSTTGSDMEIMGQTQLSMFTTDENGKIAFGENEACIALDYEMRQETQGSETFSDYYFVLKNGIKFSDGEPLTMEDVLFNLYVLLDPAYAGSSTMYSTDIYGLSAYRTQERNSDSGSGSESGISTQSSRYAIDRLNELIAAFQDIGRKESNSFEASPEVMRAELQNANSTKYPYVSEGYMKATGTETQTEARAQLLKDYENALEKFRKELDTDYKSAKDSYREKPYVGAKVTDQGRVISESPNGFDEILAFMFSEGYATVEYEQEVGGTPDRSRIKEVRVSYASNAVKTKEDAIEYVYTDKVATAFDQIISFWGTGAQLRTEFTSKAKEIVLNERIKNGNLEIKRIEGIESMGHNTDETSVTIGSKEYKIAHDHNEKGEPVNSDEYDVLRIRVNGIDPKAIWNFGFTVAPAHYYGDPTNSSEETKEHNQENPKAPWDLSLDIKNDKFGVAFASFDFQMNIIQGKNQNNESKNSLPVGAGIYMATDRKDSDFPKGTDFVNNNIVYYKANPYFMFEVQTEHLQYRVTPATTALESLKGGEVHFVTPQFTKKNGDEVFSKKFEDAGFLGLSAWQLGYGYIGVNAGKVEDINLRRAIMVAMDTSLATQYYSADSCVNIQWPMSAVSWAYPRVNGVYDGNKPTENMKPQQNTDLTYASTIGWTDQERKDAIKMYMERANASKGDSRLTLKFTIAGADLQDHPCYATMFNAMNLLNECGWDVSLTPDANALIKLSTGSLTVWAAAWGSSLDPDMYQIYHRDSTATSVLAWGYAEIKGNSSRKEENEIINQLSDLIDQGRETNDQAERTAIYEDAMLKILELAVELPVYQRKTLYALNLNVIDKDSLAKDEKGEPLVNSYSSPLNRLWEIKIKT